MKMFLVLFSFVVLSGVSFAQTPPPAPQNAEGAGIVNPPPAVVVRKTATPQPPTQSVIPTPESQAKGVNLQPLPPPKQIPPPPLRRIAPRPLQGAVQTPTPTPPPPPAP